MKIVSAVIAATSMLIFAACASPPTQLARSEPLELSLDTGTCKLTERGWAAKENPIQITGERERSECRAGISDEKLKGRAICVLSGLNVGSAPGASYYGCRTSRENNGFLFRAQLEPKDVGASAIACAFLCY